MGPVERRTITRCATVVLTGLSVIAGCGDSGAVTLSTLEPVPETVELGEFPEPLTGVDVPEVATPTSDTDTTSAPSTVATTAPRRDPISGPLGDEVFGNRIILIGDTVIASTSPRFDGSMCDALEAFGWQTEIEAEFGRFVDFGMKVYDARIAPDSGEEWDAVGIMFGNHFDGDVEAFRTDLTALVTAVSPRPTIVYTVDEDDTYQESLNEIIRELPRFFSNVVVIDWAQIVRDEPDVFVADTPSDLSDEGRARLALFTAAALGEAPSGAEPGCVESIFTDDSAIVL
ncbi:MAG: hypothetical protein ABIP17_06750 [Ilumatobacteraceae bacterium]